VLGVLHSYACSTRDVAAPEIIADDSKYVLPFIESELDPGVFTDCVLVHDYLDLLNAHGVPHDESLRARFRSKTYVLSEFINPSWSERREIDFKHYNDWRLLPRLSTVDAQLSFPALLELGGEAMKLTREEILAVYEAGPEAVVSLVQTLLARIEQLEVLEQQTATLAARVRELELRLSRDSHNSHKPPSSDGLAKGKKRKKLRPKSGRRSGGQPGHPGHTLRQVERPDRLIEHAPQSCGQCGLSLAGVEPMHIERRQVFDLPPLALEVTEHQAQRKRCTHCGEATQALFPPQVSEPVQYGPGILALGVYLQHYPLLPYARTQALLEDLFGAAPSEATLGRALEVAYRELEEVEAAIHQALRSAAVVHFDETGLRVCSRLQWLHVAGTAQLTYYAAQAKRGREAHAAIALLPGFAGVAVHDAYPPLLSYAGRHALCNAHLLRELIALEEETREPWPSALILLLLEMKQQVERARAEGAGALPPERRATLRARYDRMVESGCGLHPPPPRRRGKGRPKQSRARNLLDRLRKHPEKVLAFVYDFGVPFDNNLAERDLRMSKLKQKISGGFRTAEGAAQFCRIRGYISTLRKQSTHVLTALESLFTGHPHLPQLAPG
jgi:transposase